jgi:hypothetical protein
VERTSLYALKWLAENRERLLQKRAEIQGKRLVPDRELLRWFDGGLPGGRVQDA